MKRAKMWNHPLGPMLRAILIVAILLPLLAYADIPRPPAPKPGYNDPRLTPRPSTRASLANPELDYLPEQLLVGFRPGATPAMRAQAAAILKAQVMRDLGRIGAQQWKLPSGMTPNEAAARLAASPVRGIIEYAEPNYVVDIADHEAVDMYLHDLWGMHNVRQTSFYGFAGAQDADIDALEAWGAGRTGSRAVKVAVIDTGVDYNHEDLKDNIIPGYDFVNSDADPMDDNGHGTHVAGIIGALGANGIGVKGVSPLVSIMPVKGLDGGGSGDSATLAQAINYAATNGAQIINASWGSTSESKTIKSAIAKFNGLFVAAAGNNGSSDPFYPAASSLPNIVAVAATEDKDRIVGWSNYGTWVHIAAPGVGILSTYPSNRGGYAEMSGTSMAAPHVAGAAAQVTAWRASQGQSVDYATVKQVLINTADIRIAPTDHEDYVTPYHREPSIRLNLAKALGVPPDTITGPGAPTQITDLQFTTGADGSFTLSWTAPGSPDGSPAYGYDLRGREVAASGDLLANWDQTWNGWFLPRPAHRGTTETFTISGWAPCRGRKYEFAIRAVDVQGNWSPISTVLLVALPGSDTWDVEVAAPYGLYWVAHTYDSAGNPAVAYLDTDPAVSAAGKPVAIARRINGEWVREVVPGTEGAHGNVGLAFSPVTGRPAVSWARYISWGQGYGVYVSKQQTDGTWRTWQIDTGGGDMLAFEPGTDIPATIYAKNGSVMFARIVNGSVVKEIADRKSNGIRYRRLAYAPDGTAAVVYSQDRDMDGYLETVSVARRVAGKWVTENVETGTIGYGVYATVAWNPVAAKWALVHGSGGTLRFLQRNPSGGWTTPEFIPGDQSSLAFKSDGTAVVAHVLNQNGNGNIAVTTRSPTGFWDAPDIVEYCDWSGSYISSSVYGLGDATLCWGGGVLRPEGYEDWGVKFARRKQP